jgi:hypothetical protein
MKRSILVTALLVLAALVIAGCTTAGPYVTDVGLDGEGNLMVHKNTVVFNAFFGTVSNGDKPTVYTVKMPKR